VLIYVALENLRSLHNIGAIFRTCSFFGVTEVLLVGYSGKTHSGRGEVVLHSDIQKTALGSEKDLNITFLGSAKDLIAFAKGTNLNLIAVEQHKNSTPLNEFHKINDVVLVFGNEVEGVSELVINSADKVVEVPRKGIHGSLNVTTVCGIILSYII